MQKAQVGDYFKGYRSELLGDVDVYLEVVDFWGESGYCLRETKAVGREKDHYLTDEDLDRLELIHYFKCIQVTLPDSQSKLILRVEDLSSFELDAYLPDVMFMEPGDTLKMEVILYPKDKFDTLKEFEG